MVSGRCVLKPLDPSLPAATTASTYFERRIPLASIPTNPNCLATPRGFPAITSGRWSVSFVGSLLPQDLHPDNDMTNPGSESRWLTTRRTWRCHPSRRRNCSAAHCSKRFLCFGRAHLLFLAQLVAMAWNSLIQRSCAAWLHSKTSGIHCRALTLIAGTFLLDHNGPHVRCHPHPVANRIRRLPSRRAAPAAGL